MTRRPRFLWTAITSPIVLLMVTLGVHVAGRAATFCSPFKVDSMVYAVAAYRVWQPDATVNDLIPDKPPGQALLTGWVYRLTPAPPSRLPLIPVESLFLISAYAVVFILGRRLFGARIAAAVTLVYAVAHNSYSALDSATDAFNTNEMYLALPTAVAMLAHLTGSRRGSRGFLRGLGLGVALSIKQTAIVAVAAMLIHDLIECVARRGARDKLLDLPASLVGILAVWVPLLGYLAARGWLRTHLADLSSFSGKHLGLEPTGLSTSDWLTPLAPVVWWIMLGAVRWLAVRRTDTAKRRTESVEPLSRRSMLGFALLWLAGEAALVRLLNIPASHYFQQLVAPAVLLGGLFLRAFADAVKGMGRRQRVQAWQWALAGTVALLVVALKPLLAEVPRRVPTFDPQAERALFAHWLETWSPHMAVDHMRED